MSAASRPAEEGAGAFASHGFRAAGAVLTGGRSTRMGSTKALIEVGGTPMAARVVAALRAAGIDPVVLVGGDPAELAALDVTVLDDLHPDAGPLGGVLTALRSLTPTADAVVVVSCDLPYIEGTSLARLLDVAERTGAPCVARGDRLHHVCAVWPAHAASAVARRFAEGERSLWRVQESLGAIPVDLPPEQLWDVNTPQDLSAP